MTWVLECEHLAVDYLDRVWLTRTNTGEVGPHFVGYLGEDPTWPAEMGEEPNWWLTEVAWLEDRWEDGIRHRRDYRREIEDTYRRDRV